MTADALSESNSPPSEMRPIPQTLLDEFRRLSPPDVLTLMGFHYSFSSGNPERPMDIEFGDSTGLNENKENHCLRVSRSRKTGEFLAITIRGVKGVSYEDAVNRLETLAKEWAMALEEKPVDRFAFAIFFSAHPVIGHYTLKSQFSLREMPAIAPKADTWSGWHPFVLTFRYEGRSDHLLQRKAEAKQVRELQLLLNILLPTGVRTTPQGKAWVMERSPEGSGKPPTSLLKQLGYISHGLNVTELQKIPEGKSTVPTADNTESFSQFGPKGVKGFFVPEALDSAFENFTKLDKNDNEAFIAAARHFKIAESSAAHSISYAHIALVSAIETISNHWSRNFQVVEKCDECDQPRYKLSSRFRSFLRTYAGKESAPLYRKFYDTRSSVLHSGEFLRAESMGMWDTGFEGSEDNPNFRHLRNIVRVALINWLEDPRLTPSK
ncbi:MAG: hypothetical protein PHS14_05920 [Elusimicrobia bacterium]|nr:hypothetical protein [Elusimicrobiota bacterium]